MKKLNWIWILGIILCVSYILHDVLGMIMFKTYNPLIHEVSMLTSVGAPSRVISTLFSTLYGILSITLVGILIYKVKNQKHKILNVTLYVFLSMHIVSCLGYLLFPLTYGENQLMDNVHVYAVTVYVVISSIISMIGFMIYGIQSKINVLVMLTIATLILMVTGAMGTNLFKDLFGIFERLSSYSVVLFTGVLGTYMNHLLQPRKL